MKGQHVAVWRTRTDRYRLLRGPLRQWLPAHGIAGLYTPPLRGWKVRTERVADVVAQLEAEGVQVHIKDREAR